MCLKNRHKQAKDIDEEVQQIPLAKCLFFYILGNWSRVNVMDYV